MRLAIARKLSRWIPCVAIHPLLIFGGIWLSGVLLYALHLSYLLVYSTGEVERLVALILLPFVAALFIFNLFLCIVPKTRPAGVRKDLTDRGFLCELERRLNSWFRFWLLFTAVEVVFSGGIPLQWLLFGGGNNYTEFGLPVIHVLAVPLLAVIAMGKFGLYVLDGDKRRLRIPLFQILWAIAIVSRGMILTVLLQYALLWICLRGIKTRAVVRALVVAVLFVFLFGYIGDSRAGGGAVKTFRDLARTTPAYPDWLPSGALWIYIYVTSPLGNLLNTATTTHPAYDPFFSRTILYTFPTPIRNAIYGRDFAQKQDTGDLVDASLNVSSAYLGPYLDYGYTGIGAYSVLLGLLSAALWKRRQRTLRDQILYVVIAQCLAFSIFWNFLFYNAYTLQFFWIYLLLRKRNVTLGIRLPRLVSGFTVPRLVFGSEVPRVRFNPLPRSRDR